MSQNFPVLQYLYFPSHILSQINYCYRRYGLVVTRWMHHTAWWLSDVCACDTQLCHIWSCPTQHTLNVFTPKGIHHENEAHLTNRFTCIWSYLLPYMWIYPYIKLSGTQWCFFFVCENWVEECFSLFCVLFHFAVHWLTRKVLNIHGNANRKCSMFRRAMCMNTIA